MRNLFRIAGSITLMALCVLLVLKPLLIIGQDNIMRNAVCEMAPVPNYKLTKSNGSVSNLNDGRYSTLQTFWLDPLTLGWQGAAKITFNFKFDNLYNISKVSISTVTGLRAGISLPLNLFVFVSENGTDFRMVGDIMDVNKVKDESYRKTKLSLDNINTTAKYMRLVIVPNGLFFFTDEIEVFKGGKAIPVNEKNNVRSKVLVETANADSLMYKAQGASINRKFLLMELDRLDSNGEGKNEKLKALRGKIEKDPQLENVGVYDSYKNQMMAISGTLTGLKGFGISQYNTPWEEDINSLQTVNKSNVAAKSTVNLTSCVKETKYIAFRLSNYFEKEKKIKVAINKDPGLEANVFWAQEIRSRNFKMVPDALIPIENGATMNFVSGESKMIIVALKSTKISSFSPVIQFKDELTVVADIDIFINVLNPTIAFAPNRPLSIINWAYFNYPLLKGRENVAHEDLLNHYVNTLVLPPSILLPNNLKTDYSELKSYLKYTKGFQQVLLFLNYGANMKDPKYDFLSDTWKQNFLGWYDNVISLLHAADISDSNIYLYPFDEVHGNQVDACIQFSNWIKSQRKNAKVYATIAEGNVLGKLKNYLDVYQLLDDKNILKDIPESNPSKAWLYDTKNFSKSLSPYSYYRLMAWKAFSGNFAGIGFWNYADVGLQHNAQSAWDDFDGKGADYSVIYDRGNQIIGSRRWEAFKAGIEDYMLLSMYAQKFGNKKAQLLCISVLNAPTKLDLADKIRKQMIVELSK